MRKNGALADKSNQFVPDICTQHNRLPSSSAAPQRVHAVGTYRSICHQFVHMLQWRSLLCLVSASYGTGVSSPGTRVYCYPV